MSNYDEATGCHYGAISVNSISGDMIGVIYDQGENLTYNAFVEEVRGGLRRALKDYFSDRKHAGISDLDSAVGDAFDAIADGLDYQEDDDQYLYEADGYKISNSPSLSCLFVELSPYYTETVGCSLCVPNAGDLDHPLEGGLKTYCLGPEWFDDYSPTKYPVYAVLPVVAAG